MSETSDKNDFASQIEQRHNDSAVQALRRSIEEVADNTECEDCGEQIPSARRKAVPWARRCVDCQQRFER